MSKFLQYLIISSVLLVGFIGCVLSCFLLNSAPLIIIMTLLSVCLFVCFIYLLVFALTLIFGKKINASIVKKEYIPSDNNDHSDNAYYKYTYQVNINNKIKTRSFKIYCLHDDIVKNLNIGNIIEVRKFLFITSIDENILIKEIRSLYKPNDTNSQLYQSQKKHYSKTLKKDLIIGLSVFALIVICCLIYVFTRVK